MNDEQDDGIIAFPHVDHLAIYERVRLEFLCTHPEAVACRFTASNGTSHFRRQCVACGTTIETLKRSSLNPADLDGLPAFDPGIGDRWYQARKARTDDLRAEAQAVLDAGFARQREERRRWYNEEYLQSATWRAKRRRVIERAKGICEGCLERPATQVHHVTYKHVGAEFLFELKAVCDVCHRRLHDIPQEGA